MNRVRDFFVREAEECLRQARTALEAEPELGAAHSAVRRFRGSAQMARYGTLAERALALEHRLGDARREQRRDPSLVRETMSGVVLLERELEEVRAGRMEQDPKTEEDAMAQHTESSGGSAGGTPNEVVPIEALEYSGAAALDRAESLREPLQDAIAADGPVGPVLDELFDLIRLGRR